ncbi:hypothetical protein GJ688_02685 [Heliobacillus mobilis]|uniref:Lipoprotein n=1 Tax=Heliobacterium mobile TaxID=28064 RepID=A0A6I3SCQ9_HELMO|nr:hypothetical protein [Heliobacterium mobile]MTV47889.1 hypothetical protein [Heliobacterium mobile]
MKLKVLFIVLTFGLILTGCSETMEATKKEEPKTVAVQSETLAPKTEAAKKEEPSIKTGVFAYAKKVDITDARDITKHVTATVFMSDELTPALATQHVLTQSYDFLQQDDLKGANTVTIGVMKGDIRVFQYTVDMKKFVPKDSEPMANVVLKASKVEKMFPQVEEYAKTAGWNIIK